MLGDCCGRPEIDRYRFCSYAGIEHKFTIIFYRSAPAASRSMSALGH
jgi:hypothetical protein